MAATAFPRLHNQSKDLNELELYYRIYNEKYFENTLPKTVIIYWDASVSVDELAVTSLNEKTEPIVIFLSLHHGGKLPGHAHCHKSGTIPIPARPWYKTLEEVP